MKLSLCSILLASLSHSVFCNASGDQHESSLERILAQQHKIQRNRSYTKTHDGRQLAVSCVFFAFYSSVHRVLLN